MPNKKYSRQNGGTSEERSDSSKTVTLDRDNKDGEQDDNTTGEEQRNQQDRSYYSNKGKEITETIDTKAEAEEKAETETNKDANNRRKINNRSNSKSFGPKPLNQSPDRSKSMKNNRNSMPTSRKSNKTFTSRNSNANFNMNEYANTKGKAKGRLGEEDKVNSKSMKGNKKNSPFQDDRSVADNLTEEFYSNGFQYDDYDGRFVKMDEEDWSDREDVSHVML